MNNSEALEPCPFISDGRLHRTSIRKTGFENWNVECSCGASGPCGANVKETARLWNTRYILSRMYDGSATAITPFNIEDVRQIIARHTSAEEKKFPTTKAILLEELYALTCRPRAYDGDVAVLAPMLPDGYLAQDPDGVLKLWAEKPTSIVTHRTENGWHGGLMLARFSLGVAMLEDWRLSLRPIVGGKVAPV